MKKQLKIWLGVLLAVGIGAVTWWYLRRHMVALLQPAGQIGEKERNLLYFCAAISVLVVVPVFWLLIHFAWKYREGNKKATYDPDQHGSWQLETVWWLIPTLLIGVISVITWRSSYALDPYKRLASAKPTMHIQVVALDWKWLFIYPEQHVASVNEVVVPVGTPVDFEITSDTVMSSFWVPQLGGQMYAMPGMATVLNLKADREGNYRGLSANIGGKGFADMKFVVRATSGDDFKQWVAMTQHARDALTPTSYAVLSRHATQTKPSYYSSVDPELYDTTVMKYMMPMTSADAEAK